MALMFALLTSFSSKYMATMGYKCQCQRLTLNAMTFPSARAGRCNLGMYIVQVRDALDHYLRINNLLVKSINCSSGNPIVSKSATRRRSCASVVRERSHKA